MEFVEEKIGRILRTLPSECPTLDYKVVPYKKHQNHKFIKDVIANLNSLEGIGKDKYILFGVTDDRQLRGIDSDDWRDDNEWQNLARKITPEPAIQTGTVSYDDKIFGYVYISKDNVDFPYEVKETEGSFDEGKINAKSAVFEGQAYTRRGSTTEVLHEDGRRLLRDKKIIQNSPRLPDLSSTHKQECLKVAALIGGWSGKTEGDKRAIQNFYSGDYAAFITDIKSVHSAFEVIFSFKGDAWKCRNHKELLTSLASFIYDEDIDLFFNAAREVFGDADPVFNIPANQRFYSSYEQAFERKIFSYDLLKGIAETIAILGNFKEDLNNCTKHKITKHISDFLHNLFQSSDWKIYATISDQITLLGEAAPAVFLDQLTALLTQKDATFFKFLNSEDFSGDQLGFILRMLATKEKFFALSMRILLLLSETRESFLDVLVEIIHPRYPQTEATLATRLGVFRELARESEEIVWKALVKLMPGNVFLSSPVPRSQYMPMPDLPDITDDKESWKATLGFFDIACDIVNCDHLRMIDLLQVYDDVRDGLQDRIVSTVRDNCINLNEMDKANLWNELQDIIRKHRKYSNTDWALPEARLAPLITLADWLIPDSKKLEEIRLFRHDQHSLRGRVLSYEEEMRELQKQQVGILVNEYKIAGLVSLLSFVDKIENRYLAGALSVQILERADLVKLLGENDDIESDAFLRGLLSTCSFEYILEAITDFPDKKKAMIFCNMPLTDACIEQAEKLSGDSRDYYWKTTPALMISPDSFSYIETTVERLNACNRAHVSLAILFLCISLGIVVSEEHIAESLLQATRSSEINQLDVSHVKHLMNWLRTSGVSQEKMVHLEWECLDLLVGVDYKPIFIFQALSDDPSFFVCILKLAHGKTQHTFAENDDPSVSSRRCRRLLRDWRITPGLDQEGIMNETNLTKWITEVKEESVKHGLHGDAMYWFGQAAFYAPADPEGFFINRKIARYLHEDTDDRHMRRGYYVGACNSRGVHNFDPTGKAEFDIADSFRDKARLADEAGLFKFAETLRDIEAYFRSIGEMNIEAYRTS